MRGEKLGRGVCRDWQDSNQPLFSRLETCEKERETERGGRGSKGDTGRQCECERECKWGRKRDRRGGRDAIKKPETYTQE